MILLNKECFKCKSVKPVSSFTRRRGAMLHSYCKTCLKLYVKDWRSRLEKRNRRVLILQDNKTIL